MAVVYITRRERFSSAHKLAKPEWSEEKNQKTFGKCSNANWHGHNYELWITVKGEQDPETSFVADLSKISDITQERVISKLDHKNIDMDVDFMQGKISSTENLAIAIWEQMEEPINALGCTLHCIKVQETENNHVEYFGS